MSVVWAAMRLQWPAACVQAVSALLEQHTRQFAGSIKDILDPKKLSAGAGASAGAQEGARSAHGSAANKWQVCRLRTSSQHKSSCSLTYINSMLSS